MVSPPGESLQCGRGLLAEFVECCLAFVTTAVTTEGLADPLFGNTDGGKPSGNAIAEAWLCMRVGRVRLVHRDHAAAVLADDAGTHGVER
jgi:hypothetical protein